MGGRATRATKAAEKRPADPQPSTSREGELEAIVRRVLSQQQPEPQPQPPPEKAAPFSNDQLAALEGKPGLKAQAVLASTVWEKTTRALDLMCDPNVTAASLLEARELLIAGEHHLSPS